MNTKVLNEGKRKSLANDSANLRDKVDTLIVVHELNYFIANSVVSLLVDKDNETALKYLKRALDRDLYDSLVKNPKCMVGTLDRDDYKYLTDEEFKYILLATLTVTSRYEFYETTINSMIDFLENKY